MEAVRGGCFLGKAFLKMQLFPSVSPPAFDISELQKNKMFQKNLIFSFGGTKPRGRVRVVRAGFQAPRREMKAAAAARHLSEGGLHLWGGGRDSRTLHSKICSLLFSRPRNRPPGAQDDGLSLILQAVPACSPAPPALAASPPTASL